MFLSTGLPQGIGLISSSGAARDIEIENCHIHHATTGVTGGGYGVLIRNNLIHDIASSAIKTNGTDSMAMTVENNIMYGQIARIVRLRLYGTRTDSFVRYEPIIQDVTGARATVCALKCYESIRENRPVTIRPEEYGLQC